MQGNYSGILILGAEIARVNFSRILRVAGRGELACNALLETAIIPVLLPLPMWRCGPTDEGARLRTGLQNMKSEFNSLHPLDHNGYTLAMGAISALVVIACS